MDSVFVHSMENYIVTMLEFVQYILHVLYKYSNYQNTYWMQCGNFDYILEQKKKRHARVKIRELQMKPVF